MRHIIQTSSSVTLSTDKTAGARLDGVILRRSENLAKGDVTTTLTQKKVFNLDTALVAFRLLSYGLTHHLVSDNSLNGLSTQQFLQKLVSVQVIRYLKLCTAPL
jgi:uncharacterized membrane-anchored protein